MHAHPRYLREPERLPGGTHVDTFMVAPRWIFFKIYTNEGITGIGEVVGGGLFEARKIASMAETHYP